jgi:serine/threonine-protein kinase
MRRKSKLWGSPVYFSPEMLSSSSFSLADDIWSIGVIMYEINCGSHPFNLKDTEDLSNIMTADFQSLPEGLNPRTTKLIARLLAKN